MSTEISGYQGQESPSRPNGDEMKQMAAAITSDPNKAYMLKVIETGIAAENMTAREWSNKYSDQYRKDKETHFPGWSVEDLIQLQDELSKDRSV